MKYLIIILPLLASCSSNKCYVAGEYIGENPIEYVFDVPESEMCKIIEFTFDFTDNNRSFDFRCYYVSKGVGYGDYTLTPLVGMSVEYISKVYVNGKGKGYPYYPFYKIYLDSVDIFKTKVRIEAHKPSIETGMTLLPVLPHFVRGYKKKPIKPTSVEEYELLLILGRELGIEQEMPKLKIPPQIIIRTLNIKK